MMKLLLLLSLIVLVSGDEAFVAERTAVGNDVSSQETALQAQPSVGEIIGEKKLGKRSYSSLPLAYTPFVGASYIGTYTPVLPWYRSAGLSSYGLYRSGLPLSLGWPSLYDGLHGGWYKGW